MNFDLSEEQEMLRDAVARFVRDEYDFEHRRKLAVAEPGFSRENWRRYAELGWLALNVPEDVGGLGCSFVETSVLMEQFGRGLVLEPFVSTAVLGVMLIAGSQNAVQRETLLPAVAAGELLLAFADAQDAVRARKGGKGFVLSGTVPMVLDAPSADRLLVTARLDDAPALLLVPRNAAGLSLDSYPLLNGIRAADLQFKDVEVEAEALLASGDEVEPLVSHAIDHARAACMAASVGSMEACMDLSADYIKQRSQFGQTLSKFQSLQHLVADMFVDAQQSRSMQYCALASLARPGQRSRTVALAKTVIGAAGNRVAANGVQLHGGYGVTDEYAVSHHFRHLFVLDRLYGSAEEHLGRLEPGAD